MSIGPTPSVQTTSFILHSHDEENGVTKYILNVKELPQDRFHIFWHWRLREKCSFLIATALKYTAWHPSIKPFEEIHVSKIHINNALFFHCSFPKELLEACQRAAKMFKMHIINDYMTVEHFVEREARSDAPAFKGKKESKYNLDSDQKPKHALAIPAKKNMERLFLGFPKADNILWFESSMSAKELQKKCDETIAFANYINN